MAKFRSGFRSFIQNELAQGSVTWRAGPPDGGPAGAVLLYLSDVDVKLPSNSNRPIMTDHLSQVIRPGPVHVRVRNVLHR